MHFEENSSQYETQHENEEATLKQLLRLENAFRENYAMLLTEMKAQKEMIDRMWVLSQRYVILVSTGRCCKYPEIYSTPAENVILKEYHDKMKLLRSSNCRLRNSLDNLGSQCRVFEELCGQLDMTLKTTLVVGDAFHKPLAFFIELVSDLFKYLHASMLQFKCRAHQLDPADSEPLTEYRNLLQPSEDFEEYLMVGLSYCKCLRPKEICR